MCLGDSLTGKESQRDTEMRSQSGSLVEKVQIAFHLVNFVTKNIELESWGALWHIQLLYIFSIIFEGSDALNTPLCPQTSSTASCSPSPSSHTTSGNRSFASLKRDSRCPCQADVEVCIASCRAGGLAAEAMGQRAQRAERRRRLTAER